MNEPLNENYELLLCTPDGRWVNYSGEEIIGQYTPAEWRDALAWTLGLLGEYVSFDDELDDQEQIKLHKVRKMLLSPRVIPTERPAPMAHTERELRRVWCLNVAGVKAYMDDGELQDNTVHPTIDFLRDSVDVIKSKIAERFRNAELATVPAPSEANDGWGDGGCKWYDNGKQEFIKWANHVSGSGLHTLPDIKRALEFNGAPLYIRKYFESQWVFHWFPDEIKAALDAADIFPSPAHVVPE